MPPSEIVGYLGGWNINISHEQLLRPTPEFVESVYYACLEQVTSISLDSIRNPVQNALAALEDSDQVCIHHRSNRNANPPSGPLFHRTDAQYSPSSPVSVSLCPICQLTPLNRTRFANAARILDFNARDIATPTSERTRYILAAFINLMRFTQQRASFVQHLREKSDGIMEERNKASQELSNYREKTSAMKFVSSLSFGVLH